MTKKTKTEKKWIPACAGMTKEEKQRKKTWARCPCYSCATLIIKKTFRDFRVFRSFFFLLFLLFKNFV